MAMRNACLLPYMGLTSKAPLRWGVIKVSKGTWISGFCRAVSQVVLSPGDPVWFQKLLDLNPDLRGSSRLSLIFLGSLWSKNPASICRQPTVRWAPCQVHPWNRGVLWEHVRQVFMSTCSGKINWNSKYLVSPWSYSQRCGRAKTRIWCSWSPTPVLGGIWAQLCVKCLGKYQIR